MALEQQSAMRKFWKSEAVNPGGRSGPSAALPPTPPGTLAPVLRSGQEKNSPAPEPSSPAPQTDDSGFYCDDKVHVKKDPSKRAAGDVSEPNEEDRLHFHVAYMFYADFGNKGKLRSGPCFVRFKVEGDMPWAGDYEHPSCR
jgi:hypothetical protein